VKKGKIHVGTSGWSYKHWQGTFYPENIKPKDQFEYYQQIFDTVELNSSFYHLPSGETFLNWKRKSPENFIFSIKASRYITHMKKLDADKQTVTQFFLHADKLGKKQGPVLFQLPPKWNVNIERLHYFIKELPARHRYTFEFRNQSWYVKEIFELLQQYGCAFCIYELAGHLSPLKVTADFVYIRLHGPGAKYQGSYTTAQLKKWAIKCKEWQQAGKDVYIYFDNDQDGYAAFNAKKIKELIT
jgi:uncharacterized protein YecE (DUF72 family)